MDVKSNTEERMTMKRILVVGALILFALAAQPVMASMFSIYIVYDENSLPVPNALVAVWEQNNKIDSGPANENGVYTTFLREGAVYRITAETDSQKGEWEDQASGTITIRLKPKNPQ